VAATIEDDQSKYKINQYWKILKEKKRKENECSQLCEGSEVSKCPAQLPSQACTSELSVRLALNQSGHAQIFSTIQSTDARFSFTEDHIISGDNSAALLHGGYVGAIALHPFP
jgi:hypothetical protein